MTLVYLRVITGCVDGKIRIFNFLTGDCLREITAEAETVRILSLHFHDNRWVRCLFLQVCFSGVQLHLSLIISFCTLLQNNSECDLRCEALPVCQSVLGIQRVSWGRPGRCRDSERFGFWKHSSLTEKTLRHLCRVRSHSTEEQEEVRESGAALPHPLSVFHH